GRSCAQLGADQDAAAFLAPEHLVGRRGADAPQVNRVEGQVAALTPAVPQNGGTHGVLGTQPVVQAEQVTGQVRGDAGAAVLGLAGLLVDLGERSITPARDLRQPPAERRLLGAERVVAAGAV